MTIFNFIFAVVVICLAGVLLGAFKHQKKQMDAARNGFQAFKALHPECVGKGRVTCPQCRSDRIFVRRISVNSKRETLNAHVCGVCGHELYKSVT